jgi:hypothetical protein
MTDTHEAVRLADWLQAAVQTYPQVSADEPGGYCSEMDQMIDQAAALLRRIPELEAQRDQLRAELEKVRVPEGWKLVPVEPTREMWEAVNKLDDEMAAGGYDGKGCSIEQAWNCLLDFAPTPPNADQKGAA